MTLIASTQVITEWPKILAPFLYTLTTSNINQLKKNYLFILLPVPSNVIIDVIGNWSEFFQSFVCFL